MTRVEDERAREAALGAYIHKQHADRFEATKPRSPADQARLAAVDAEADWADAVDAGQQTPAAAAKAKAEIVAWLEQQVEASEFFDQATLSAFAVPRHLWRDAAFRNAQETGAIRSQKVRVAGLLRGEPEHALPFVPQPTLTEIAEEAPHLLQTAFEPKLPETPLAWRAVALEGRLHDVDMAAARGEISHAEAARRTEALEKWAAGGENPRFARPEPEAEPEEAKAEPEELAAPDFGQISRMAIHAATGRYIPGPDEGDE